MFAKDKGNIMNSLLPSSISTYNWYDRKETNQACRQAQNLHDLQSVHREHRCPVD